MRTFKHWSFIIGISLIPVIGIFSYHPFLYAGGNDMLVPAYYPPHDKPVTPESVCGCSFNDWSVEGFAGPSWNKADKSRDIGGKGSHPTGGTDLEPVAGLNVDYDYRLLGNPHDWQLLVGGELQFAWTTCDTGGQAQVGPTKYNRCYTGPVGSSSYSGDADLYTALLNAKLGVAYKCFEFYVFGGPGVTYVDEDDSGTQGYERVQERCCGCCDPYIIQARSYSLGSRSDLDFTWDAGVGLKYGITEHLFLDTRYTYEDVVGFGTSNSLRTGIGWKF